MQQLASRPVARLHLVPYGLFSLWDLMFKISIEEFLALGHEIAMGEYGLDMRDEVIWNYKDLDCGTDVYSALTKMRDMCKKFGSKQTKEMIEQALRDAESRWTHNGDDGLAVRSSEEFRIFVDAFKRELDDRLFLHIPTTDAAYYENNKLLTDKAKLAFHSLAQELRSAGNAYACGLPTACVFHCMRGLEHALSALARDVGITWTKEQWHTIIEMIEAAIEKERKSLPKGVEKDDRLHFLSQAAKEFFYFKDGWRNHVAHNKVNYESAQALQTLVHVRDFAERLCSKLAE